MEYSSYQLGIFNAIENGASNIIVNAVAGSGKTFTIVEACKRLGLKERDVQFLAFNKSIATELQGKLKGYANVSTSHSFGFSVIKAVNPKVRVDNMKYNNLIRESVYTLSNHITPDTDRSKVYGFCQNVLSILNLCRVNLIQYGEIEEIRKIVDANNQITLWDEISVVNELLENAYNVDKLDVVDFTDMITLPLYLNQYIPTFKFVFVDECQDLNTAQRMLMQYASRNGRFVAVGDRRQAINGFAGADCQSFDKIASLPNTIELPLSVNYRCGKNMIKLAQDIVPHITAHDDAIDGIVDTITRIDQSTFRANDMVLCRSTAPLVGMCFKMIQSGITACVKGRDIAEQLIAMLSKFKGTTAEDLDAYLDRELSKCIAALRKERNCSEDDAKNSGRYISLNDRCQCLRNIASQTYDVSRVKDIIKEMFNEYNKRNAVVLSTVHKAKGLEADRVLILCPDKLPLTWKNQLDWQLEQELNLKYVALTRAKKELIFVNMDEKDLAKSVL